VIGLVLLLGAAAALLAFSRPARPADDGEPCHHCGERWPADQLNAQRRCPECTGAVW